MIDIFLKYFLYNLLISTSIAMGFFFTSIYINKLNESVNIENLTDEDDALHINSFLEELDYEPMSNLSEEELLNLKSEYVFFNLEPLLKQTIQMCYDHTEDAFCYYSERETIYKYLDIIARYYVITNHCKQIYEELGKSEEKVIEEPSEVVGPFVSKKNTKKKVYEKKFLRFIYKGNLHDYITFKDKKESSSSNDINILDFLKMKRKEDDSDEYENITKEE
jgi:hypothetical protein